MNNLLTSWEEDDDMAWANPVYNTEKGRRLVNIAGNVLIGKPTAINMDIENAYAIIDNWRSSHNFPLNTFQTRLRKLSKEIDPKSIVAQRIKRLASIEKKLQVQDKMKLTQIQDLGGCRAIVGTISHVNKLVEIYTKSEIGIAHELATIDNYIQNPKKSGYRGIHLVYKYHSSKNPDYSGLKIEIQIRTLLQHAWATAVETVGTFINQPLKSGQGDSDWLNFFYHVGLGMAVLEPASFRPPVFIGLNELQSEIVRLEKKLDVRARLSMFRTSLHVINSGSRDAFFYLLELDPSKTQIHIKTFNKKEGKRANEEYLSREREILSNNSRVDAVLVSVDSFKKIERAYPNYYLDTELFINSLSALMLLKWRSIKPTKIK